ncbi:hypothetical protein LXL04_011437 [Taraxacum kok-saghyz]
MGRRKVEIKRIHDKSSRVVTFSKRRAGLFKKARHISVLCDVDVAVIVFSDRGKLYEVCSGRRTNSVGLMFSRYQNSCLEGEEKTSLEVELDNPSTKFRTCKELLEMIIPHIDRIDEEPNEVSLTYMIELEEELNDALLHTRSRKTQLMTERMSTFHEQERKLIEENEKLEQEVGVAKKNGYVDYGDEGVDDFPNGHYNYETNPYPLSSLPLFKE